ncbi:MAG: hypothetical protein RL398_1599 [Planctomycetota bacterium]|jgi:hypothetical protein
MQNTLSVAAAAAALLSLAPSALAQNCYDNESQCHSFAPEAGEASRIESGISLRSKTFTVTGDIRFRYRGDDSKASHPYVDGDQMTSRARIQLAYQATENAKAFVEFTYAETWNGSESYSDALAKGAAANPDADGVNFNGIGQAYIQVDDMLGAGDNWRVGRSTYILGNGLILGSCDYLQYPDTFTGAWVSRTFDKLDVEAFVFDDDGSLQAIRPATRFYGATGRFNVAEDGVLRSVGGFYMAGTGDGDNTSGNFSNDSWYGVEAKGKLPAELAWNGEWAQRQRDGADDVQAYRVGVAKKFEGVLEKISATFTDSEGAMHVNPADFNSAGLLHQYGGAWRSDLDTIQLGASLRPGCDFDVDINLIKMDRDGAAAQQGEYELDVTVGKQLKSGVHASAAYGVDDEDRQVVFVQLTLFF